MKVSVEFTTRFHNMDTKVGFYSNILSRNILTFILKQSDPFTLFKVQLDTGTIKGFTDNGITKFLGVPYASIPSKESKCSLNALRRHFIINFDEITVRKTIKCPQKDLLISSSTCSNGTVPYFEL